MRKITVGSLFAGIGGLELGLEQTGGFKTVWSVEIDEYCNRVRREHWPHVPQYRDIRDFPPDGIERPDLICGGSPCQDLSVAGKQAGIGGWRSSLFFEMVRIVRVLRPRWVVWENVRGAISSNGGSDFRAVLRGFSDIGYDAEWTTLRASDFGLPHRRERVFVVAYPKGGYAGHHEPVGERRPAAEPEYQCDELAYPRRDLPQGERETGAAGLPVGRGGGATVGDAENQRQKRPRNTRIRRDGFENTSPPGPNDRERWDAILSDAPWLAPAIEPGFRGMADGLPPLLDLPGLEIQVDDERRKRLKALGNAVVPACARWIGERILEAEARNEANR